MDISRPAGEDDPLSFWQQNKSQLLNERPETYKARLRYLWNVENMFSTTGILLNGKRSLLAPHLAKWLSFVHDNFPIYLKSAKDSSE